MRLLATGVLVRAAERKTASNGKEFAKAMIRVDAMRRTEDDPEHILIFAVAFGETSEQILEMQPGESIAFSGKLDLRAQLYQDKPQVSANVAIDKLITARRPPRPQRSEQGVGAMVDDPLPF